MNYNLIFNDDIGLHTTANNDDDDDVDNLIPTMLFLYTLFLVVPILLQRNNGLSIASQTVFSSKEYIHHIATTAILIQLIQFPRTPTLLILFIMTSPAQTPQVLLPILLVLMTTLFSVMMMMMMMKKSTALWSQQQQQIPYPNRIVLVKWTTRMNNCPLLNWSSH